MATRVDCLKQVDQLLDQPHQIWLLGAGVSRDSGIPTMQGLTKRVRQMLPGGMREDFERIASDLSETANVEEILSQIGDFAELASRSKTHMARVGTVTRSREDLVRIHASIREEIRKVVQWGYIDSQDGIEGKAGTQAEPLVTVDRHVSFVNALYQRRREGVDSRPPIAFFTTNYDTLLEDALALCRVPYSDGFCGGAMGFWAPDRTEAAYRDPFARQGDWHAKLYKLHGSIDWFRCARDIVVRRRAGTTYPKEDASHLIIYPQTEKYRAVQEEPFATVFSAFRAALESKTGPLLCVCGYSFGDDHITEIIERAMATRGNSTTILAFARQRPSNEDSGLPATLVQWLEDKTSTWRERVLVMGSHGLYHGNLDNLLPTQPDKPHAWATFDGLIEVLRNGLGEGA